MRISILSTVIVFSLALDARADGFAIIDEHVNLNNNIIVEAGDVEKLDQPDGTSSNNEILKINSRCLQPSGYMGYWGYGKKAGLLLVDNARTTKLALLESSVGSIKVTINPVLIVECPTTFSDGDQQKLIDDIKKRIEKLKRQSGKQ